MPIECGGVKAIIRFKLTFSLSAKALYGCLSGSPGYGDKLRRVIDAADPGAVPGGSTRNDLPGSFLTGPNQDRRVLKNAVFARNGTTATAHYTSANDNEALAIAA
jgi:hypothetical protein